MGYFNSSGPSTWDPGLECTFVGISLSYMHSHRHFYSLVESMKFQSCLKSVKVCNLQLSTHQLPPIFD